MSNEKQVVKKGGLGKFFLGFFLGFISFAVVLVGAGFIIIKNVSIQRIENMVGISVPIKDELKRQPLEKILKLTIDLAKDGSSLTLQKVEDTFGIFEATTGNSIPVGVKKVGDSYVYAYSSEQLNDGTFLDISVFSTTYIKNLADEAKDFVKNLSLTDLQKIASFNLPDVPVINNVKSKPLTEAMQEISESLNFSTLTLRDLNTKFGVDLTNVYALKDFLDVPFNGEGNNNLQYVLNNAKIANFVGLSQNENESDEAYAYRLQEQGILGVVAKFSINDLQNTTDNPINNLTLGDVMGLNRKYVREGTEGNYTYSLEEEADYNARIKGEKLLGELKDAKITELQTKIDDLHIPERTLAELEEWGLVDLSSYTLEQREKIEDKKISDVIAKYVELAMANQI